MQWKLEILLHWKTFKNIFARKILSQYNHKNKKCIILTTNYSFNEMTDIYALL